MAITVGRRPYRARSPDRQGIAQREFTETDCKHVCSWEYEAKNCHTLKKTGARDKQHHKVQPKRQGSQALQDVYTYMSQLPWCLDIASFYIINYTVPSCVWKLYSLYNVLKVFILVDYGSLLFINEIIRSARSTDCCRHVYAHYPFMCTWYLDRKNLGWFTKLIISVVGQPSLIEDVGLTSD